tara:strand:- start:270 stop:467 length:198 start_codon:yes stop_codon:yes gene_type:complete
MKVTLEYDTTTGNLTDSTGSLITTWTGLVSFDTETGVVSTKDLVSLAEAGYEASDIMEMKKKGIL